MLITWISSSLAAPQTSGITQHLTATLHDLQAVDTAGLALHQQAGRAEALAVLEAYIAQGVYPHNHVDDDGRPRPVERAEAYPLGATSTPIFIDQHGTHCAVGELMAGTGYGDLAQRIATTHNQVFIDELALDRGVGAWAAEHGLTLGELARIQPGYAFMETPPYQWPVAHKPIEEQEITLTQGTEQDLQFVMGESFHSLGMCATHLSDTSKSFEATVALTFNGGAVKSAKLVANGTGIAAYGKCAEAAFAALPQRGELTGGVSWTWTVRHRSAPFTQPIPAPQRNDSTEKDEEADGLG